ncbi:cytochrome C oxidase subunit IV family protein [Nocardia salmonicida]|uniref:cytochrome C oxidase subunit IV family protein n=1 Tax=Nocardia salmonicida TaxID=53431 RepID=UPI000A4DD39E|nr:cytochrome C oxidase subunit IV family protein [Nocardia salmonicida]
MSKQNMIVWLALITCTIASWSESSAASTSRIVAAVVLSLTAGKVVLVIGSYMEVGRAPLWLRLACGLWATAVFGVLTFAYLVGTV